MKKIWIMAGESSGDMYGAALAAELRALAAANGETVEFSGMGGAAMIKAGIPVKVDSTELGVIGVFEVLKSIFTFIRIFFQLVNAAKKERPDAVVLIDYPGFNIRFAKKMHQLGIPVYWYISPQVWVWNKKRLPVLAKVCTKMLVIFPFEVEVYSGVPLETKFVGHPLVDVIAGRKDPAITRDDNTLLLLPGSRKNEIERLLVPMLETVCALHGKHPQLKIQLSTPREKIAALCRQKIAAFRKKHPELPEVSVSVGDTGYWQQRAGTGLAASGTVTVECALAGLPLVVGYKLNFFTLVLAKILVKLYRGFFTMVNIIANREVYQEFLQWHFCPAEVAPALEAILPGGARREEVLAGMNEVKELLTAGSTEPALRRAAREIYNP
ncbi:MAG: lipid-A-disaccharide synthase [Lentisphaerae bacterium]|nr:lipid-A-disaccharide synthase [Lentisphaerota bacterium]MBQ9803886.1 lipid-A-disaccharide synthase [Lentisphaeria bacterium]